MPLDENTTARLAETRTVYITTWGRRSGRPSRIEIWWFRFEGRFVITGVPGRRHWLASLAADPSIVVHDHGQDHRGFVRLDRAAIRQCAGKSMAGYASRSCPVRCMVPP